MFRINRQTNRLEPIQEATFAALQFREREHVQEWLVNHPEAFGEELLFIQKEFDGFDDTRERLDLLALDKQGNIVVIENKLDDSGRDVTWQALKYASYCSSLSKLQIREIYQSYLTKQGLEEDAGEAITEFMEVDEFSELQLNQTQRIILVAANYRKEVTSTVLWLLTNYQVQLQCFKLTPYLHGEEALLSIEQIIPVPEAAEFTIKMAEKAREEQQTQQAVKGRHKLRYEFWTQLLEHFQKPGDIFSNVSPKTDHWLSMGSGISGVIFNFIATTRGIRVELYLQRSSQESNKAIFDQLYAQRAEIDQALPGIIWERLDEKKASRIRIDGPDLSLNNREDWSRMIDWLEQHMRRMVSIFQPYLATIR